MSRLDSVIRRLSAQRDTLNSVAAAGALPTAGAILELGLGNGRTFSHLRALFPDRRILAFDRALVAHGSSVPDEADLVLGEIAETTKAFFGGNAAMVHADIGTGYPERDAEISLWLAPVVARLLAPGGVAVSGLPLRDAELQPMVLPEGVPEERYFLLRRPAIAAPQP